MEEMKEQKGARNVVGRVDVVTVCKGRALIGYDAEGLQVRAELDLSRERWVPYPPHDPTWKTTDGREIRERYSLSICGEVYDGRPTKPDGSRFLRDERFRTVGQCLDWPVARFEPHGAEIVSLWRRWHLNTMRAGCAHQGDPHADVREVTRYHWRLKREALAEKKAAEAVVMGAVIAAGTVIVSPETRRLLSLPWSRETWTPEAPEPEYEKKRPLYDGDSGHETRHRLTSLRPDEHPEGLLCRPCPTCGYRWGSAWLTEELPPEVVEQVKRLCKAEGGAQ